MADGGNLVGRDAELARLLALWAQASSGRARLALIAGRAGTGKTRLAAEVAAHAEGSGGRALAGSCRRDGPQPYEPFVEALGPTLAGVPDEWAAAHAARYGDALAPLFPALGPRVRGRPADPVPSRTNLLSALADAVTGPRPEPVLLVIDDLHWATESTVAAVLHLLRHKTASPLLVLCTYRDTGILASHPLAQLIDEHASPPPARIILDDLSPHEIGALLVDRAAVAGATAVSLARRLWTATGGNPLLVTETVRDLAAAGAFAGGSVDQRVVERVGAPRDVAALLARRLHAVPPTVHRVLEAGAAIGPCFDTATVADLCEMREDDAGGALDRAAAAGALVPAGRSGRYRFVHDLVRDAVHKSVAPNRRVRLHHALAERLEEQTGGRPAGPGDASRLLHHRVEATPVGRSPDAVRHARQAGEAALAVQAYEEAAGYFGQALAFAGNGAAPVLKADLLTLLGSAHDRSGEQARARQSYLQAAAYARTASDGPRLAAAALGLGEVVDVWGADGLLIDLLRQALATTPESASLRARLIARLAQAEAASVSPDERKARSDQAWELAWDSRDPATMGAVLRSRHQALSAPDDLEDRVEIDGELYAMAHHAQDAELLIEAHGWRLVDLLEQGHVADAQRDRQLHGRLARRSGDQRHRRDAEMWAATFATLEGHPERAIKRMGAALSLGNRVGDAMAPSYFWLQQLAVALDWGNEDELAGLVDVWTDLVRRHDRDPAWRSSLALLLARSGRRAEAVAELDDLADQSCADIALDRHWLATVTAITEVAALVGDDRSTPLARLLAPYSRRLVVVGPGVACRGSVARVMGLAAATARRWGAAERHFQAALSAHERIGSPPLVARTRMEFARALCSKEGGPLHVGRAQAMAEQSFEEAGSLGLIRVLAEAGT